MCARRLKFIMPKLLVEFFKGRGNDFAQKLAGFIRQRFAPFLPAPAEFERGVFQPVNFGFGHRRKAGLERGKPVVLPPVKRDGAERAPRQLGERVMRHGLAAVEKERNAVTMKRACQRFVIGVEIADEHGTLAETPAVAGEFQNFPRGEGGFGLSIGAGDHANRGWRVEGGGWILSWH